MKIKVLVVGKTKEKWCKQGEKYYLQRIAPFADIEYTEIAEEKISPSVSEEEVKKREGEKMLSHFPNDFISVALSPQGKEMSSVKLSEFFQNIRDYEGGKICFLIGGPLGLSDEILRQVNHVISFSQMTFPHDIFRIFLNEQIYRAFSLLAGKKYHK